MRRCTGKGIFPIPDSTTTCALGHLRKQVQFVAFSSRRRIIKLVHILFIFDQREFLFKVHRGNVTDTLNYNSLQLAMFSIRVCVVGSYDANLSHGRAMDPRSDPPTSQAELSFIRSTMIVHSWTLLRTAVYRYK